MNYFPHEPFLTLRYCAADDQRSVFNAARTHSRLHQAAVATLHSITAIVPSWKRDRVLSFLQLPTGFLEQLQ
jgi:hypothetical protein